jgi:hypothetical protein
MVAEPSRYHLDSEAKALIKDAEEHPILVDIDGTSYEVSASIAGPLHAPPSVDRAPLGPSPYTIDTVYGSLPLLSNGNRISDEDLEHLIDKGKQANLRDIVEGMTEQK